MKLISTRAPEQLAREVERLAAEKGTRKTALIRIILSKGLQQFKIEDALKQYKEGKATLWKASKIAGIPLWAFIEKVKEERIPVKYSLEDAIEELERVFGKVK